MKSNARTRGVTLSEIIVAVVVFMLLSTSLVSAVTLGLRFWLNIVDRTNVQQNTLSASDTISCELRQAIVDSDPVTGYMSVIPAISPSGVLYPNENDTSLDYIDFTEPNPANYDPSQIGWNPSLPTNYRRVKFYIENNILYREQKTFDSYGSVLDVTTDPAVQSVDGVMTLEVKYTSPTTFEITLDGREGENTNTITSQVYIPSE